ncbi:MAG: hypothetical protein R3Y19_00705, partial [Rikenellaceae bacterium]
RRVLQLATLYIALRSKTTALFRKKIISLPPNRDYIIAQEWDLFGMRIEKRVEKRIEKEGLDIYEHGESSYN